ncbi:hypothetical protein CEW91_12000 [Idiomarina piscisalsi]|uniref:KAP NTPase domain-containing protein n=1 Tax=Idiomarina piscisalsi TaxID=1096243 RepID=A0ABN5ASC4_9GAMM|nr:P-loop NTPase fold protein [Idiomarina piscisalsi]ASG66814.1 hypothetical protein CEW91_12000 [Idiomarina piscisalsi]
MNLTAFKPLTENVSSNDELTDKVHERTAEAIYQFIKNERSGSEGLTIGLEGSWGSGKSHIINLTRGMFSHCTDTLFFSFDAWAHEGDPLRKAFLNELINEAINRSSSPDSSLVNSLEGIKAQVNRGTETRLTSHAKPSVLGLVLMLSLILTPLGYGLLASRPETSVSFYWGHISDIDWRLVSGGFCFVPLTIALYQVVSSLQKVQKLKEVIKSPFVRKKSEKSSCSEVREESDDNDGRFFTSTQTEFTAQKTLENGEPTSWDFSRYYDDVIKAITADKDYGFSKIVIVIDNIDRLSRIHARGVWSTLQTFFQSRSSSRISSNYNEKDIWYLIPYDRQAFCEAIEGSSSSEEDLSSQLGLLDKNFQVVFEVPPVVSSTWVDYFSRLVDTAFGYRWNSSEVEEFKEAFERINSKLHVSPTIREMRAVVNRAGAIAMQTMHSISTKNICLYVCMRRKHGEETFRKKLISSDGFSGLDIENHDRLELATILFNVEQNKAAQLLLEEPIIKALQSPTNNQITELYESHLNGFRIAWRQSRSTIGSLLDSDRDLFVKVSDSLIALAELDSSLVSPFNIHLRDSWGRFLEHPNISPSQDNFIASLSSAAKYFNKNYKSHLLKIKQKLTSGVQSLFTSPNARQHSAQAIAFYQKAVSIPEILNVWKPFYAEDIEAKNWVSWKRSEKETAREVELAVYPARKLDSLTAELNVFGSESSNDIWIIEEIFEKEPESPVWEQYLDKLIIWLNTKQMTDAESQFRLAHKVIDSDPKRYEEQTHELSQITRIGNPRVVLTGHFNAFFIARYVNSIPPQVRQNLHQFWNTSADINNELNDVIEVFRSNPEPLWLQAIGQNSNRAKSYINEKPLELTNNCEYVALNFDKVTKIFPKKARQIARQLINTGLADKLFDGFLSSPNDYINDINSLAEMYPELPTSSAFDSSKLNVQHWLLLLERHSPLCINVSNNEKLSEAFEQFMKRIIQESNRNLENFGISADFYNRLAANVMGENGSRKRRIVECYFSTPNDHLSDETFRLISDYLSSSLGYPSEKNVRSIMLQWIKQNKVDRVKWFINTNKWFSKYYGLLEEIKESCPHRTNALVELHKKLK